MSEKEKDPGFCGLKKIWETGEGDGFWEACKVHDAFYIEHLKGESDYESSKEIDQIFWDDMGRLIDQALNKYYIKLRGPGRSSLPSWKEWLKYSAYEAYLKSKRLLYYSLVRSTGMVRWKRIKGKGVD